MKKIFFSYFIVILIGAFHSCDNYLEPELDNTLTLEQVLADPSFAEGLLLTAYTNMPGGLNLDLDIASDDATTNLRTSNIVRMATGEWQSSFNPVSRWEYAYQNIWYINFFLKNLHEVQWSWQSQRIDEMHRKRLYGEAHGLRAWYNLQLLQFHSGVATNGELLGFPVLNEPVEFSDNLELPRNSFIESLNAIIADLDTAIHYLPDQFVDTYIDPEYDEALGERWSQRISGRIARALKARALLIAASPAYEFNNIYSWEDAAKVAGELVKDYGGANALPRQGLNFYLRQTFRDLSREPELIWMGKLSTTEAPERNNFPPSLFGSGRLNPSQNLVDAFPMSNGYPIDHPLSGYDQMTPYQQRDPRLALYILFNGGNLKGTRYTYQGAEQDGINNLLTSTRTGYYLKKFMNPDVVISPVVVQRVHYTAYFRMTELMLIYAEAANEAWGPDDDPTGLGFTSRDVIREIRRRANLQQPDNYLNSITEISEMRDLIRNERRLELCFEGHRFWDIRRWMLEDKMTEPITGVFITRGDDNTYQYSYDVVEQRIYQPHMIYGPIPYSETLKYNILQNAGWQ